jgi:glycosyltransferase involved in cell wall biosynthesis
MRVLHVVPGMAARTGGVASAVVQLCLGLEEVGVATTIVSTDLVGSASSRLGAGIGDHELPEGADRLAIQLYPAHKPFRLAYSPALQRALSVLVQAHDLVHIHSLYLFPQFAAYRSAKRAHISHLVSVHGALDPWLRRRGRVRKGLVDALWQRAMLEQAAVLHFGAADEAQLASDVAPMTPRAVISNPLDWKAFGSLPSGRHFREHFLRGFDGPLVLFLGRITPKKRVDLLIRAFAVVAREHPDCRLAVAGPDEGGLRARLEGLAAGEPITFVGMLRGEDKLSALAAADVWVLPSHSEGASIAFAEALAAGLPSIAPASVTIAADAAAAGASVGCELTLEGIANAIGQLLDDGDRRAELRRSARAYARRFDRASVAVEFEHLYRTVVGDGFGLEITERMSA